MLINKPKGTKDIFGSDQLIYDFIFKEFEKIANSFCFNKIITPTFEYYDLFFHSSGESSDIVKKELYHFYDLSKRHIALKPEGTAPVARFIEENKLHNNKEFEKIYYIDKMFRYEKPQKGRLREFYQIGVESFFKDNQNINVLEIIFLAKNYLNQININDQEYEIEINYLSNKNVQNKYINILKKYFMENKDKLTSLSKERINLNPLRILDDKNENENIIHNAPKIDSLITNEEKEKFNAFLLLLEKLNIKYKINPFLVRGMDYYNDIVFEFVSNDKNLGSKNTIIGGGCYNNLLANTKNLLSGCGFGIGVERLFEILKNKHANDFNFNNKIDIFFIIENNNDFKDIFNLIIFLRNNNLKIEFNKNIGEINKKFNKIFKEASSYNPNFLMFKENEKLIIKNNNKEKLYLNANNSNEQILKEIKLFINKNKG